jgi:predicted NBD/HSP70 family sugar kinase
MNILTFDIGGTSVKYGVIDKKGEIYEKGKFITPKDDINELMANIAEVKVELEDRYQFDGIAMSCPGAVDDKNGIIGGCSAVPCIHGFNIKAKIRQATGIENVRMENDANCAALAEVWKGAAVDYKDVLFVILGSGVGGAVIKDKKIHKGANLQSGEFGYMIIADDCQNLSLIATPVNMAQKVAERKGIESINGEEVFKLAEKGDKIAIEEIERFYNNIAVGIFNLQYVYDPEVIVIGGGISEREDLIDNIQKNIDKIIAKVETAKVRPVIRKCIFRNDANLIGAVYNYMS